MAETIDQILMDLPGVLANQDDTIVLGKTEDDHHENLCRVLQQLQDNGIKARQTCSFYKDEVIFCGIKISGKGLHKTEDIVSDSGPQFVSDEFCNFTRSMP